MKASEQFIRRQARTALMTAASGVRDRTCDVVSAEFATMMADEGHEAYGTVKAPFRGRRHYVAVLPGSEVSFTDAEYVIVDATVQQFQDDTALELPEVAVIPSDDSRWDSWYSDVCVDEFE